jgi:hypothetical protein
MGGVCNGHVEMRNEYTILVGTLEGKIPLGRRRRRWGIIGRLGLGVWIGLIWLRIWNGGGLL